MQSKLNYYQGKLDCYVHKMFYVNLVGNTSQNLQQIHKLRAGNQNITLQKVINLQRKAAKKERKKRERKLQNLPINN